MSDSEHNRLKTGAFTFRCETRPQSSYMFHLTLLVSHLSLRDKLNLICDVEVCAGQFFLGFIPHSPAPAIYSLFLHISDERKTDRLTNKV